MERRNFIKGMAAAGALVAVWELPASAQSEHTSQKGFFPGRAKHERLSLRYAVVDIGLKQPFSVLHISDTHLAEVYPYESDKKKTLYQRRNATFGGCQEQALADSLEWAKQNVDYVIHTGDLIDFQSEANFDLVRKYFGEHIFGSIGNHEFSPDMWLSDPPETKDEAFKDMTRAKLQQVYPFDISFCSRTVNGVRFITMDDVYGYVTQRQVEAFKAEAEDGLPIVLCMHVPFFSDGMWRVTDRFWSKCNSRFTDSSIPEPGKDMLVQRNDPVTRDFISYLKGLQLLKAILVGHEHLFYSEQFSPTATQYLVGPNYLFSGEEILFV